MNWLIADIGGTWTRCATASGGQPSSAPAIVANRDFAGPGPLLRAFLDRLEPRPHSAAIGVAAPVGDDRVHMLNLGWTFSREGLRRELGLGELVLVNDFEAVAWSLPGLGSGELAAVGGGDPVAGGPRVAIGPGTGLGVAALVAADRVVVGGEGGHVSLAAQDDAEERVIRAAREEFGHCSAERILSGSGLGFLHQVLHGGERTDAAELGRRLALGDAAAAATFEQFFRFLGGVAGDLALTFCATGGVYIGGGIAPRYVPALQASGFRRRFEAKGRYRDWLAGIPAQVITAPEPALRGLALLARS